MLRPIDTHLLMRGVPIFNRSYTVGTERDYRNSVYDANVKHIKAPTGLYRS